MSILDSELTLTNLEASGVESRTSAVLVFDVDSMRNTTLRLRGHDKALYTVRTSKDTTELLDARSDEIVAKIRKRDFLPDQITLRGRDTTSITSWLSSRKKYPVTFESGQSRYKWYHDAQRRLALFHENAPISEPIAWFTRSGPNGPANLALTTDAEIMRDEVVAGLLILEQDLRVEYKDVAGGWAVAASTSLGSGGFHT